MGQTMFHMGKKVKMNGEQGNAGVTVGRSESVYRTTPHQASRVRMEFHLQKLRSVKLNKFICCQFQKMANIPLANYFSASRNSAQCLKNKVDYKVSITNPIYSLFTIPFYTPPITSPPRP